MKNILNISNQSNKRQAVKPNIARTISHFGLLIKLTLLVTYLGRYLDIQSLTTANSMNGLMESIGRDILDTPPRLGGRYD